MGPRVITCLLLLAASVHWSDLNVAQAQKQTFNFRHITQSWKSGLGRRTVEDANGVIWMIAGDAILRRYGNGTQKRFPLHPDHGKPDSTTRVNDLAPCSMGSIWVATSEGLGRLRAGSENIELLAKTSHGDATASFDSLSHCVAVDPSDAVWFGSGTRIMRYVPTQDSAELIYEGHSSWSRPRRIHCTADGTIWVTYRNVVTRRDPHTQEFEIFDLREFKGAQTNGIKITSSLIVDRDSLLVGSHSGLFQVSIKDRQLREIRSAAPELRFAGPNRKALALCLDAERKKLWIGTKGQGLYLLDLDNRTSTHIAASVDRPAGLPSNAIYALMKDRRGSLWVTTKTGISVLHCAAQYNLFSYLSLRAEPFSRGQPATATDALGRSHFMLPQNQSLAVYDPRTDELIQIEMPESKGRKNRERYRMVPGSQGDMWIASVSYGLIHVTSDLRVDLEIGPSDHGLRDAEIESITFDGRGDLLIAHEKGMDRYSPASASFERIEIPLTESASSSTSRSTKIRTLAEGRSGHYLSSALGQLFHLPEGSTRAEPVLLKTGHPSLQGCKFLIADEEDSLVIATRQGIIKADPTSGIWSRIDPIKEVDEFMLTGMIKDNSGCIWFVQREGGLLRYDPSNGDRRRYSPRTGTGPIIFRRGQHAVNRVGKVTIFAGEGVIEFLPDQVGYDLPPTKPIITSISVHENEKWTSPETNQLSEVHIGSAHNRVTIQFQSPNNIHDEALNYSYRVSGSTEEWEEIGSRRIVELSNLPPGRFDFQVRVSDLLLGTHADSTPLALIVTLPWFERQSIRVLLGGMLASLLVMLAYMQIRRERERTRRFAQEANRRTQAEAALAESKARLTAAFASTPCATWIRDREGIVLMASAKFKETWGNPEGLEGPPPSMPALHAKHWNLDHKKALSGKITQETLDYRDSTGDCRAFHVVAPILVDDEVKGTVGIDIDISAIRRGEQERYELEQALQQKRKLEAVGKLAGGIAHDFNNILTAICGHAELIKLALEESVPPSEIRADIDDVITSSQRATGLTRQLLLFSQKGMVTPEEIAPEPIVRDMRRLFEAVLTETTKLTIKSEADLGMICADRSQFEQVVLNLVVNSADAMPRGGLLDITLTRATILDKDQALKPAIGICVTDTGSGMTREVIARVFEPYFTTKPIGESTGLGLATVHGIVTGLNGQISIESLPGQGTAVTVLLPRTSQASSLATPNRSEPQISGRDLQGSEVIVICEDDSTILNLTSRVLQSYGYRILKAATPERAIEIFKSSPAPPHLLVTDVIMPGMDGRQLAATLRTDHPDLKVLFMSGYTSDLVNEEDLKKRNTDFLQKPFSADGIGIKVRALLEESDQRIQS